MADARLTLDELTEVTSLQTTDVVLLKRPGGATLKVEVGDLLSLVKPADSIHAATAKAALADADEIGLADSGASFLFKKFTLSSLISSIFKTSRTISNAQFSAATFKLFNASSTPRALAFNTTALTADRQITIPDRDVNLGNISVGSYTSADQTITFGSNYTLAHGLGVKPTQVFARLRCITAELGYSAGDEIVIYPGVMVWAGQTNNGFTSRVDATNLRVKIEPGGFAVSNTTGGANPVQITAANWKIVFEARP